MTFKFLLFSIDLEFMHKNSIQIMTQCNGYIDVFLRKYPCGIMPHIFLYKLLLLLQNILRVHGLSLHQSDRHPFLQCQYP